MAKRKEIDNDELQAYYTNIYDIVEKNTINDPYGNYVLSRVKGGQKTVFNKAQTELRNFDMSFLDTIESVYPAILKIMRDPKKSLRYEEEIVDVSKAKKVNSQTVRHLSSHTQLIKEITKAGDVIPSKVMTTYAEEELGIYENRFIKSLVKRMEMFLERRYEVMKESLESFETNKLNVNNEFLMSGQKISINLDIQIKNDLTANIEATKAQYERLLNVRELVQALKGTDFMRALAKAKEVLPPIMKTNIIMHNPDFKLCYGLWLYLDEVDTFSTEVEVKERSYRYTNIFEKDINEAMTLALTSFLKNRDIEGVYSSKNIGVVKPPKIEKNEEIQLEMNFEADNQKMEDYRMNQILLDETAKFFEASLSGMQRTGNNYNESIRTVYRQMLDMVDQIYPKAFGVADDELESKDYYEQLEFVRRRKMIFNIVRQQKQMNIARMGKEEKKIDKLIENLNAKIKAKEEKERIKEEKERARLEAIRIAQEEKERAKEERRKRLEKEAIKKQREAEKAAIAKARAKYKEDDKKKKAKELARTNAAKMRDRMKEERKARLAARLEEEKKLKEEREALERSQKDALERSQKEALEMAQQETDANELSQDELDLLDAIPNADQEAVSEEANSTDLTDEEAALLASIPEDVGE